MSTFKKIIFTAFFSLIIVFLGYFVVFAWTAPTSAPPGGNIAAPLNIGSVTQSKTGGLNVGGNVGIGTTGPLNKLDVSGGMAVGSYAGVNAAASNNLIVSGNLGIGTASPMYALDIVGGTRITGRPSRVFVSSVSYNGNLGGLSGADAKCASRAMAAGLSGTWKALLSDSITNAKDRIFDNTEGYQRMDGAIIGNNLSDLFDATINNPVNLNEYGVVNSGYVWTGSDGYGNKASGHVCNDWTGTGSGNTGSTYSTNYSWINSESLPCSNTKYLYCFEQIASKVIITSNNVGIGTTAPKGLLHLAAPDESTGSALSIRQSNAATYGFDLSLDQSINGDLYLDRVVSDVKSIVMSFVRNTGNVGIGTMAPEGILSLSLVAGNNDWIQMGNESAAASKYIGIATGASFGVNAGFSGIEFGPPAGTGEGYLAFHTHDVDVASAERMRIDKSGNVGIGTTNPAEKLDVNGNVAISGALDVGVNRVYNACSATNPCAVDCPAGKTVIAYDCYTNSNLALKYFGPDLGGGGAYARTRGVCAWTSTPNTSTAGVTCARLK